MSEKRDCRAKQNGHCSHRMQFKNIPPAKLDLLQRHQRKRCADPDKARVRNAVYRSVTLQFPLNQNKIRHQNAEKNRQSRWHFTENRPETSTHQGAHKRTKRDVPELVYESLIRAIRIVIRAISLAPDIPKQSNVISRSDEGMRKTLPVPMVNVAGDPPD